MKAPEKIYADPKVFSISDEFNDLLRTKEDGYIEYTRTDAFIEKACEYLQNTKRCVVECIGENVYKPLLSEEEIMEFCKSMKGE